MHFEKKLLRLLGLTPQSRILQPFGGMGEYGLRCDLRRTHPFAARFGAAVRWMPPNVVADAHALPFASHSFDLVFCDPPYSTSEAAAIYGTPPIVFKRYIAEAVRVSKVGGFVCSYHVVMTPRPPGTTYHSRILLGTRTWHRLRACCVFQKSEPNV